MLYSDRIETLYPGYKLTEDRLKIIPGPQTPVINLASLKELLLSKDLSRMEEFSWL